MVSIAVMVSGAISFFYFSKWISLELSLLLMKLLEKFS